MENKLKDFEKEFLYDMDYIDYVRDAQTLQSDITFFQEYMSRNRKSTRFTLEVLPSQRGCIKCWFVKKLFYNFDQVYWLDNIDTIVRILKLHDITNAICDRIAVESDNEQLKYFITRLLAWNSVILYFSEIDILKDIHYFLNSGYELANFWKIVEEIKGESSNEKNT